MLGSYCKIAMQDGSPIFRQEQPVEPRQVNGEQLFLWRNDQLPTEQHRGWYVTKTLVSASGGFNKDLWCSLNFIHVSCELARSFRSLLGQGGVMNQPCGCPAVLPGRASSGHVYTSRSAPLQEGNIVAWGPSRRGEPQTFPEHLHVPFWQKKKVWGTGNLQQPENPQAYPEMGSPDI